MIDRNEWSRLGGLMFTSRRLVDGLYAGAHASPKRGRGAEFHDYRAYAAGDDLADVDWKLFGRTDRHYVRRHQRYTDLHLYLLVDASASMNFAGLDRRGRPVASSDAPTKLDYARRLAAAIAMLTVRQSDRVGLGLFDAKLRAHLPIGGTWTHLQRLVSMLESAEPGGYTPGAGDGGGVGAALGQAYPLLRRRSVVVLISDLLDDPHRRGGLLDQLARFRHVHSDVVVFQILSPQELNLETIGAQRLQLVDSETRRQVATHVPTVARRYSELMGGHLETVRRGCAARGADYQLLSTARPMVEALRRYVSARR